MTKDKVLHCVLKKEWFDKIKSGEKTHEYREAKLYWDKRVFLNDSFEIRDTHSPFVNKIKFTLGMTSKPEKVMLFGIKSISIVDGKNTDLAIDKPVYDIQLSERLE